MADLSDETPSKNFIDLTGPLFAALKRYHQEKVAADLGTTVQQQKEAEDKFWLPSDQADWLEQKRQEARPLSGIPQTNMEDVLKIILMNLSTIEKAKKPTK